MSETFMAQFAQEADDVLGAILDQTADCIKLLSVEGDIEYVNRNGLRALGLSSSDELVGRRWDEIWPVDGRARVIEAVNRAGRGQNDRFEAYCPIAAGQPRWWDVSVSPIMRADGEISHLLATSRDVTEKVQESLNERRMRERAMLAAERSDSIAREMRHRLKNQLAVVGSVAKLLARHSEGPSDLIDRLENKLQALARAQDLLTVHRDRPVTAKLAIEQVLEASGAGNLIEVSTLPDARLGDDAVQQLALILGELQTNSLKYGALGNDSGKITLTGSLGRDILTLHWHEDCGRPVTKPDYQGSGHMLLTRLGSTSGMSAGVNWHGTGPAVDFHVRVMPD
ncbi:PAS domain-containing protein [Qipengyuania soli]|uniref:histidine kinase n=1 Tax=Qipengyuania soli TaxID=2782568 RepID=A0A7S8F352_9SPHN|nr:PAS domain-containing protein [Qipengyuania soli]QPC98273.1 PAS domain-containing protein [Qipengyuania soli]